MRNPHRGRLVAVVLTFLAAGTASALDYRRLDSLAAEGARLWECSSPYARLGRAEAVSTINPSGVLRRIASDFSSAGRYDEFAYLVEYVEKRSEAGLLEVRVVRDLPPTPGFWPARLDGSRRAIVIGEADAATLSPDDGLYKSSFLRAAASLYYVDVQPAIYMAYRGRNAASELAGFMSGLYVESIYLLDVLRVSEASGPHADYLSLLLASASNDELRTIASELFKVDLRMAYDAIQAANKETSRKDVARFLKEASRFVEALRDDVRSMTLRASPDQSDYARAEMARTAVMIMPWTIKAVARYAQERRDPSLDEALAGLLAGLSRLAEDYARADPLLMARSVEGLNGYRFRPADPGAPEDADARPLPAGYAPGGAPPEAFPGSAGSAWFRYCVSENPYALEGRCPMTAGEALASSGYRFSYAADGGVAAIEYFVLGRLRSSGDLDYAARLRRGRDARGEWLAWENAYGTVIGNEDGVAYARVDREGGRSSITFFAADGRRARDGSGAWTVELAARGGGKAEAYGEASGDYDIVYRDAGGSPYAGHFGYAKDQRRKGPDGALDRRHFDEGGRPALSLTLGYHRSVIRESVTADGMVVEVSYLDEEGEPAPVLGGQYGERMSSLPGSELYELLGRDGEPFDSDLGWAVQRLALERGQPSRAAFFASDGSPAATEDGYHAASYGQDERGDVTTISFAGEDGEPVASRGGFHRIVRELDERGLLVELRYEDAAGRPVNSVTGEARIRWEMDEGGVVTDVRVWDANGSLLEGRPAATL